MAWTESDALAFSQGSKTFDEIESAKTSQSSVEDKSSTAGNVEPAATETDKVETSKDDKSTVPEEVKSTSPDEPENPEKLVIRPLFTAFHLPFYTSDMNLVYVRG